MATIRLFINNDLAIGDIITPEEKQSHYLINVMKQREGNQILCFNNKDGEFLAQIVNVSKKSLNLLIQEQTRIFEKSPDLWLLFAPVKKDQTDFIIQKATELGVSKIIPTITRHTISEKVRVERFQAQAIEACEQCRRVDIPEISEALSLEKVLASWNEERKLFYMDETGNGTRIIEAFSKNNQVSAILVGPEGGFDKKELELLKKLVYTQGVTMGKRIMRAETAVAASISCWQAISGDW
ncbi:MAG: 16S rRNA (uracil(1498)-N(3))-methyltransferase [Alphaproteobacteria bacterium]|nr:16S rRNA (uracil(1498)-N(3))-methyltransferase [Alphaproteobacteria bacterium]